MKTIAVGIGENKNILKAIDSNENEDIDFKLIYNDEDLTDAILDPEVDAVIRGSLPASKVMKSLKSRFKENFIFRATYIIDTDKEFLLTPVGIDEGDSIENKLKIAMECGKFLRKQKIEPKIAVLADGRKGDYGRSSRISNSIDESEKLTELIKKNTDFNVENYYILIERALKDNCNVIIAPDGIFGNVLFRSLVLINSWPSYGAVTFGLSDIYIDTSRDQSEEGYGRSIELAYRLTKV
ncbi:MAG: methanogenesis marker protein Mmp4/MtxX [Methanobrevibacter sp.]|uniref:methanogenesis marker protein Mmp4/MtxX n=1 Tax=Methanobrevibacter sp. TaxID=66852 RepID=UPI0026E0F06A|nr:methanogenesis marker protein Mmp4/MtxX [Methanobrevibacter sp.]MDO5849257.1 methanogenesis marker protein Mmp4/MtxX [Methanobrevibacter sp.]